MIYKQKNELKATENFLEDFLKERHIADLRTFLKPTEKEQYDFMLLDNIVVMYIQSVNYLILLLLNLKICF